MTRVLVEFWHFRCSCLGNCQNNLPWSQVEMLELSVWWYSGSLAVSGCWLCTAVLSASKLLTEASARCRTRLSTRRRAGKPYLEKVNTAAVLMPRPLQKREMIQQGPDSNLRENRSIQGEFTSLCRSAGTLNTFTSVSFLLKWIKTGL